jgi:hypothetical protein
VRFEAKALTILQAAEESKTAKGVPKGRKQEDNKVKERNATDTYIDNNKDAGKSTLKRRKTMAQVWGFTRKISMIITHIYAI